MLEIKEIMPQDLQKRIDAGKGDEMMIVDMRQDWEYTQGHIPGAVSMPAMALTMRLDELPKDKEIILQCYHGFTSLDASAYLIDNGWDADKVVSLSGGMSGWVEALGMQSLVSEDDEVGS